MVADQPFSDAGRIIAPAQPDHLGRRSESRGEFVEIGVCCDNGEPQRFGLLPNDDVRILQQSFEHDTGGFRK